jgi:signal transduction histidine kinase
VKIKHKILLVVLPVVVVSILAISAIALNNFFVSTKNEIIDKLKLTGENIVDKITRVMFERVADIKFFSGSNLLSDPDINLIQKVNFLRSAERAYKSYASMSLYDKDGIKIGDTRSLYVGLNESQKPFFTHAIRGEIYYDKIPVLSESLSQYVIHFSAPLYTKGNISGVIATRYPISKLNDIFRTFPVSGSETFNPIRLNLIANNGLVIYSDYDRKSMLHDNLRDLEIFKALTNNSGIDERDQRRVPVTIESTSRNGESLYLGISQGQGYLDYKGSGWFLILSESTKDAFAVLQKTIFDFIIAAGIILVVALILILLFSNRLTTPITRLRALALQLSEGNYDIRIPTFSRDELGDLSHALDIMRTRITETNKHLNELVNQKTGQLVEMNKDLMESKKRLESLNESLILSDKAKEEFIMMVSHELKTPITPAKIYIEILLTSKSLGKLNEKQKKAILAVHKSISRLEGLINDVLDVYKLDVGKMSLRKKEVAVGDIINENISELMPLMKDKGINFKAEVRAPCDSLRVLCDPTRIAQVIGNLVRNSVDFVEDKVGIITIRVELIENERVSNTNKQDHNNTDQVVITVEDNGPGIPSDKAKSLFKKFYQIDTTLTRKHGGTGLGLAISRGIIEAHGGKIWIALEHTNGTSIKFTLPLAGADSRQTNNNKI